MAEQNTPRHRLVQRFAEIKAFDIVDQGTSIDPALTVLPDNQFY